MQGNIYNLTPASLSGVLSLQPGDSPIGIPDARMGNAMINLRLGPNGDAGQQWMEVAMGLGQVSYRSLYPKGNLFVPNIACGQLVTTSSLQATSFKKIPVGRPNHFILIAISGGAQFALEAPSAVGQQASIEHITFNENQIWAFNTI